MHTTAMRGLIPATKCRNETPASVVNRASSVSVVMTLAARNGSQVVAYRIIGSDGTRGVSSLPAGSSRNAVATKASAFGSRAANSDWPNAAMDAAIVQ